MTTKFFSKVRRTSLRQLPVPVTVVSGLPRSGTSMMMKMLEAGGMEVVTDHIRAADVSNPKGYYEFERVKQLKDGDYLWLEAARGKAVKVISALLEYLPPSNFYLVVFMHRDINEILASQKEMLIRRGEQPDKVSDEKLAELFRKHLNKMDSWLGQQRHFKVLHLNYNALLKEPAQNVTEIARFLGGNLNTSRMLPIIDHNLYRQRVTS